MKKSASNRVSKKSQKDSHAAGDVRIIGGQFKRRVVRFIEADGLRPTPDRMRETLFNWLLADIHGARVLDSCAGSGVLGFEALSRGAAHATFIEVNPAQVRLLQQSAEQLHLTRAVYHIVQGHAEQALRQHPLTASHFDIVFIDPPYAKDLWQPILTALITHALISADTLIYLEADKSLDDQLVQLAATLNAQSFTTEDSPQYPIDFHCVKQTKVGQVVAGLYQLSSS